MAAVIPQLSARWRALPGMTPGVAFMVAGVVALPVAALGLVLVAPGLAAGAYRSYPVLAVNHLFTLGWGTFVALGALHQLFPAMVGLSRRRDPVAGPQMALALAGLLVLLAGFLTRRPLLVALGGSGVWVATLVALWVVGAAARGRRRWPPAASGVVLAVLYLVLATTWGLLMGLNWTWPFWPRLLLRAGLGTHAALGLGGWFAQLVVSVSYYLVPRFTGAPPPSPRRVALVLALLNASVLLLVGAAFSASRTLARLAAAVLATAALLYAQDVHRLLQHTRRQAPDLTIHHWWVIWGQTLALAALAAAFAAGLLAGSRAGVAAVVLILTGWVTMAITGQLYKVTPFLMWYYRFARGLSPLEVPRLPAPYYPRAGAVAFALMAAGSTALALAVGSRLPGLATAAALLLAAGAVTVAGRMVSWVRVVVAGGTPADRVPDGA